VYCLLLALFPTPLLHLVYGRDYAAGQAATILMLYAICQFLNYLQMVITAALTAARQTRYIFIGCVFGCVIALIMSPICIKTMGANGAIVSLIATTLVVTLLFIHAYLKNLHTPASAAVDSFAGHDDGGAGMTMVESDHPMGFMGAMGAMGLKPAAASAAGAAADIVPLPRVFQPGAAEARAKLLARVLDVLEANGVPCVLLHGYEQYADRVTGDVDCLIPAEHMPRELARVLAANEADLGGAHIVQWCDDGDAHLIVLAAHDDATGMCLLQLHATANYELSRRVFYTASEIMASRRKLRKFWIPAAHIEFGCVLVNRISKAKLEERHERRMTALFSESPELCRQQIARFFRASSSEAIATAAESGDWTNIQTKLPTLRAELLAGARSKQFGRVITRAAGEWARRVKRWLAPSWGMHVVFLGPDGVGKSTVIDEVREDVSDVFLRTDYHTFAPSLIPPRLQKPKELPHALPPRSYGSSLIKAGWWLFCYTALYYVTIHPTRARGGLILNHRYLLDAIVDRRRYRYSGPEWLLRAIWRVAAKPDVVILLDAPAEVIQRRKQEVALEEIVRQRDAYRSLVSPLKFGRIVDASRPLKETVVEVDEIIFSVMRKRIARRFQ
jgi:thymidylate kinase